MLVYTVYSRLDPYLIPLESTSLCRFGLVVTPFMTPIEAIMAPQGRIAKGPQSSLSVIYDYL